MKRSWFETELAHIHRPDRQPSILRRFAHTRVGRFVFADRTRPSHLKTGLAASSSEALRHAPRRVDIRPFAELTSGGGLIRYGS